MKCKVIFLLSLICVLLFTSCQKEEPVTVVDGYWEFTLLEDGTYSVGAADKNNMPSRIEIPTEFEGVAVTAITEKGFSGCEYLDSVIISDTIQALPSGAFYRCSELDYIYVPKSIKRIEEGMVTLSGNEQWITIDYEGTSTEWQSITYLSKWMEGAKCKVLCIDNTLTYDRTGVFNTKFGH